MSHEYYPTALDLLHYLEVSLSSVPDTLRRFLEDQVVAARQDLEKACGRVFLAGTSETRTYDPPTNLDRVLFIDDAVSVSAISYQPAGSTATALTLGTDYLLEPRNAAALGKPHSRVRFPNRRWTLPLVYPLYNSVRVTGRFGYGLTLPENVWLAILARCAFKTWQQQRAGTTGGILSWKDGDRSVEYGVAPTQDLVSNWASQYDTVVAQYRRLTF